MNCVKLFIWGGFFLQRLLQKKHIFHVMWMQEQSLLAIFAHPLMKRFVQGERTNRPVIHLYPLVRIAFGSPSPLQRSVESLINRFVFNCCSWRWRQSVRELCAHHHPLQLVVVKWDLGATTLRQSNHLLPWTTMLLLGPGWFAWMHPNTPGSAETLLGQYPLCVCVCVCWQRSTEQTAYTAVCLCAMGTNLIKNRGSVPGLVMAFHKCMCQQAPTLATHASSTVCEGN